MKQTVLFRDLGQMDYQSAWNYQEKLLQENLRVKTMANSQESVVDNRKSEVGSQKSEIGSQTAPDTVLTIHNSQFTTEHAPLTTHHSRLTTNNYLLFVEHPPVFTLGKSGNIQNVLISGERLKQKGIEFFRTNRGGDITFHGPQQIVGYPILDLEKFDTDIGHYLRNLEEIIIRTLEDYGIEAGRSKGETGVWIDPGIKGKERKICAIGVRCSRWITMHGFAFNVNTDLSYFNYIIPCGIQNKQVASLKKELGREVDIEEVKQKVKENFEKVFDVSLISG
jgi:lipoyl(octanoyl) transferase